MELSETQIKVMRILAKRSGEVQLAGHGMAPYLSAARALVKKGLAKTWHTGKYAATDDGKKYYEENLRV
jgi:hypothetical protein